MAVYVETEHLLLFIPILNYPLEDGKVFRLFRALPKYNKPLDILF